MSTAVRLETSFARGLLANRFRDGEVLADESGLTVGGEKIARASIVNAYFEPGVGNHPASIRVYRKRGAAFRIRVASESDADAILRAARVGPEDREATFTVVSTIGTKSWWTGIGLMLVAMFALAASVAAEQALGFFAAFAGIIATSMLFLAAEVRVGADGLVVGSRVFRRFVPWSAIDGIETRGKGILLRLENGREEFFAVTQNLSVRDWERAYLAAIVTRTEKALEAYRSRVAPGAEARLARSGRPHAEWLKALGDREGSFRSAPLLDDQLWNVVENPTADVTARAGAATLLSRNAGEHERARLRLAAEACAAPKLRVVLDRAAAGATEEEVASALEEIEDPAALRR